MGVPHRGMRTKITDIIVVVLAWLAALSLVYLFLVKLQLLRSIFH